jgi:uncharacterized protein YkwD
MPRLSPTSRWVVLPTVIVTAVLVTAVGWASGGSGSAGSPSRASFDSARTTGPADGSTADGSATDGSTRDRSTKDGSDGAASRSRRTVPLPPAGRLHPAAAPTHRRPAPPPTRSAAPTGTGTASASPPAPPTTAAPGSGGVTAQVVTLTNAERAKAGCAPLTVNSTLTAVAQEHSQDMATHNYFDHNSQDGRSPFDRMTAAGYQFSTAAENIAAGQRTPQDVMTSWMNSPGHKANILNCALHQIGVGYATSSSSQYGVYWTQDFGTPR